MEKAVVYSKEFLELKKFIKDTFAQKLSTVELARYWGRFVIDHIDSLFIKQIEEYEMVINNPELFDDFTITANQIMLKGYIAKVYDGHLELFHDFRSTIEKEQIKSVEVKIKGKLYFTITEQQLKGAFK